MNAKEFFDAGQLDEAIQAAIEDVKKQPTAIDKRSFFCELLCYAGDLERADKQLDTLGLQDPEAALGVALFRQLIRAELSRREFYHRGRVPEFLDNVPTRQQRLHLEASILLRDGEPQAAMDRLAEAAELRQPLAGSCDGTAFDDFRDLDDLVGDSLEVLTSNGKYYWVPLERIEQLEFKPPHYARDLLWRAAVMSVRGGPDGQVFIPTLYVDSYQSEDNRVRLGRATEWVGDEGVPVRGMGQRTFLVGESDAAILSITKLEFAEPATPTGDSEVGNSEPGEA